MESGSTKSVVVTQGSDDVFEPAPTQRETPLVVDEPGSSSASTKSITSLGIRGIDLHEAQMARAHFRSSGYGTGSEDSVKETSKASMQLSQESFSEAAAAGTQDTQILASSYKAAKCVENDFQPKKGCCTSVVQNTARQESTKSSHVNQMFSKITTLISASGAEGRIASGLVSSTVTAHGKDALIEPRLEGLNHHSQIFNISSTSDQEHSKVELQTSDQHKIKEIPEAACVMFQTEISQQRPIINKTNTAVTDSTHNISLQTTHPLHPGVNGNMNLSQSHISSSIRDTCPAAQDVRTKPPLMRQSGLHQQQTIPETLECSGEHLNGVKFSSNDEDFADGEQISEESLDHMHAVGADHVPAVNAQSCTSFYLSETSSSIGCQFDHAILDVLEKSARCTKINCEHANCIQMRKDMAALQDYRNDIFTLNEPHLDLLRAMFYHAFYLCHHPKCPLHWCGDEKNVPKSLQDGLQIMKQRMENYAEYCGLFISPVINYMKLNKALLYDSMPLERQDWVRLCTLGTSRKTVLAFHLKSHLSSDNTYWVIKKVHTAHDPHQWHLYSKLRDVSHKSLVSILWAASFEDHLLVCYPFENLSLQDCLPTLPSQQLELITVYKIMQQLTSATKHLNDMRIAYLYWTSKNMLVNHQTTTEFHVKICNFSCSASLDKYDGDQLYLTLPPSLQTPELREEYQVELVSDVWGLGCLLHELVTGLPVWFEHRHIPDADLKALLGQHPVPNIPSIYPELLPVFQACWETDWAKRTSVSELQQIMTESCLDSFKNLKIQHP